MTWRHGQQEQQRDLSSLCPDLCPVLSPVSRGHWPSSRPARPTSSHHRHTTSSQTSSAPPPPPPPAAAAVTGRITHHLMMRSTEPGLHHDLPSSLPILSAASPALLLDADCYVMLQEGLAVDSIARDVVDVYITSRAKNKTQIAVYNQPHHYGNSVTLVNPAKWLNWLILFWGTTHIGPRNHVLEVEDYIWAPPGEYDWTIHARRWCELLVLFIIATELKFHTLIGLYSIEWTDYILESF